MSTSRNSFVMYKDFSEIAELLTDSQAGELFKAIYHYQITGEKREVSESLRLTYVSLLTQFKRDNEKYAKTVAKRSLAGKKSAFIRSEQKGTHVNTCQQVSTQSTDSVSDSVSDSVNIYKADAFEMVRLSFCKITKKTCHVLSATVQRQIKTLLEAEYTQEQFDAVFTNAVNDEFIRSKPNMLNLKYLTSLDAFQAMLDSAAKVSSDVDFNAEEYGL